MQALGMQTKVATNAATRGEAASCESSTPLHALRDLIQAQSITMRKPGEPNFILASGRHSSYYCDTKKVTLSPEGSRLVGEVLFRVLADLEVEAVGGLELGATFIATAVALVSAQHGRPIYGFTVRAAQKKHGTEEKIATSYHPDGAELLCPGRRVVVVDDVVTGGESIRKAINAVVERQCAIVAVVSLVDRCEGGGKRLLEDKLPYFALFDVSPSGELIVNDDPRVHRLHS